VKHHTVEKVKQMMASRGKNGAEKKKRVSQIPGVSPPHSPSHSPVDKQSTPRAVLQARGARPDAEASQSKSPRASGLARPSSPRRTRAVSPKLMRAPKPQPKSFVARCTKGENKLANRAPVPNASGTSSEDEAVTQRARSPRSPRSRSPIISRTPRGESDLNRAESPSRARSPRRHAGKGDSAMKEEAARLVKMEKMQRKRIAQPSGPGEAGEDVKKTCQISVQDNDDSASSSDNATYVIVATPEDEERWNKFEANLMPADVIKQGDIPFPMRRRSTMVKCSDVDDNSFKRLIRRWHPDKFGARFANQMDSKHKSAMLKKVAETFQMICKSKQMLLSI